MQHFFLEGFRLIGENGPFILITANILLLQQKPHFQYYYIIFIFINTIVNTILKQCIKEPRPPMDRPTFVRIHKHDQKMVRTHGYRYDIYGMPSGHAENVFFSTAFNFLVFRNYTFLAFFLGCSLLTIIQRVVYNFHTIAQVIVGACVGIIVALTGIYFAKRKLSGKFSFKPDDNAYL